MRLGILVLILAFAAVLVHAAGEEGTPGTRGTGAGAVAGVLVIDIQDAIGPATADHVVRGLKRAASENASAAVLRVDTPGGLDTSMRTIVQAILASPVPVVSWVGPGGARAASAGTFISYAAHIAAMAPGTNLGAATPVPVGGVPGPPPPGTAPDGDESDRKRPSDSSGEDDDAGDGGDGADVAPAATKPGLTDKAVNDAAAYIRSLAQMRGRNADWAAKAVTAAASLSAADALRDNVIDLIASDLSELLTRIDGRTVVTAGGERTLATAGAVVVVHDTDWRTEFLAFITDPNIAYILMLVGIYGILFEFYSPGLIGPGVIGAICLILALYAFQLLPVSAGGLALTLLGLALIVAEAVTPSFGALGLGGIAAFAIGSVMLIDSDVPGYTVAWELVGSIAVVAGALLLLVATMMVRGRRRPVVAGQEAMCGAAGVVTAWQGDRGLVRTHGELWQARAESPLDPGTAVRVRAVDGLTLVVEPAGTDTQHPENGRR